MRTAAPSRALYYPSLFLKEGRHLCIASGGNGILPPVGQEGRARGTSSLFVRAV